MIKKFVSFSDCTGKNGGRYWWRCLDDEQLSELIAETASSQEPGTASIFPSEPNQVRENFEALTEVCEPSTIQLFNQQQPCMRNGFATFNRVARFKSQLKQVDSELKAGCAHFDCPSTRDYLNTLVHSVNLPCPGDAAASAALKIFGNSIRLYLMSNRSEYCSENVLPRDVSQYTSRPDIDPSTTIKSTGHCDPQNTPAPPTPPSQTRPPPAPTPPSQTRPPPAPTPPSQTRPPPAPTPPRQTRPPVIQTTPTPPDMATQEVNPPNIYEPIYYDTTEYPLYPIMEGISWERPEYATDEYFQIGIQRALREWDILFLDVRNKASTKSPSSVSSLVPVAIIILLFSIVV